jgi:hypothetical protein
VRFGHERLKAARRLGTTEVAREMPIFEPQWSCPLPNLLAKDSRRGHGAHIIARRPGGANCLKSPCLKSLI